MKIILSGRQISGYLPQFAATCGHAPARSHARSGDPAAVAGYIDKGNAFRDGILRYARDCAEQTHTDHAELVAAIAGNEVRAAERGW
ncbi:DUF2252 family protein [Nonomuraea angiospora]|uniref:DUF2252 family protein n=1 Tax=Nonomuraea angiospora TaxID=46172 RepID=UPI00344707F1